MIVVKGLKRLETKLNKHADRMERVLDVACFEALRDTWDQSQEDTPVDTGSLKSSGMLTHLDDEPGARIKYGGESGGVNNPVDYAGKVHQRVFWLTLAVQETEDLIQHRLTRFIRANVKGRLPRQRSPLFGDI